MVDIVTDGEREFEARAMSSARDKADGITREADVLMVRHVDEFWLDPGHSQHPPHRLMRDEIASAILSSHEAGRVAGIEEAAEAVRPFAEPNEDGHPHTAFDEGWLSCAQSIFRRIRSLALTPREEEVGWRPIETAPKDGRILLFAQGSYGPMDKYFGVGEWAHQSAGWFWEFAIRPTHWHPGPPLPASINEKET
jgi:hypothetical protein